MLCFADVNTRIGDVSSWGAIMARRNTLPSTSARIFSRRPSRTARVLSALLLSLSLLATLAGLGTAIYLERARDASIAPVAQTPGDAAPILSAAMVTASDTHDPLAASAAVTKRGEGGKNTNPR